VGGDEEKMAAINEAYKVLSDSGKLRRLAVLMRPADSSRSSQNFERDMTTAMIQTTLWADKVVPAAVSRDTPADSAVVEADSITSSRVRADKEASSNSSSGMVSRLVRISHALVVYYGDYDVDFA
jgi:curved DNA-binding protein CbpA